MAKLTTDVPLLKPSPGSPLPAYLMSVSVLRFIDEILHADIRAGRCDVDLTDRFEAAVAYLIGLTGAGASYPPILDIPSGTYRLRAFCHPGRVHLRGEGPHATRLVYAAPSTPLKHPGDEVLITTAATTGLGKSALDFAGFEDLALIGYLPAWSVPTGSREARLQSWHMARHLVAWHGSVDIHFQLKRVLLAYCRSDAILVLRGVINAYGEDIDAIGVGGYVMTVGSASDKGEATVEESSLISSRCYPATASTMQPTYEPSLSDVSPVLTSWHGAVRLAVTGPTALNENPLSLRRVSWRSTLPKWIRGLFDSSLGSRSQPWGAGLFRLFNGGGQLVVLADLEIDVEGPLTQSRRDPTTDRLATPPPPATGVAAIQGRLDAPAIIHCHATGSAYGLEVRNVVGQVTGSPQPVLIRIERTAGLDARPARLVLDNPQVDGLLTLVESRPEHDDGGNARAQIGEPSATVQRGGLELTTEAFETAQVVLHGTQIANRLQAIDNGIEPSRWRQGDCAFSRGAGHANTAGLVLHWKAGKVSHPVCERVACAAAGPEVDTYTRLALTVPADESALSNLNTGFWSPGYIAAHRVPLRFAEDFAGGRRDLLRVPSRFSTDEAGAGLPLAEADVISEVIPGDNVCIASVSMSVLPPSGPQKYPKSNIDTPGTAVAFGSLHFHRVVLAVDVLNRTLLLDAPLATSGSGVAVEAPAGSRFRLILRSPRTVAALQAKP